MSIETRSILDLAQTAIHAGEHGDIDGAHTLTLLGRHIRDGITVLADETNGWSVELHETGAVLTPARADALAKKIEGGRVEVSPDGDPVVAYGPSVGDWVTLDEVG